MPNPVTQIIRGIERKVSESGKEPVTSILPSRRFLQFAASMAGVEEVSIDKFEAESGMKVYECQCCGGKCYSSYQDMREAISHLGEGHEPIVVCDACGIVYMKDSADNGPGAELHGPKGLKPGSSMHNLVKDLAKRCGANYEDPVSKN